MATGEKMGMLKVKESKIVDANGKMFLMRGFGVGGWMNTENFINGYPGCEQLLREDCNNILGEEKAEYLFDSMLDNFLAEEDIVFMKQHCGCSVVRLPLNYRHFESDARPFKYIEKGFRRLDKALGWCKKHRLYAILDMHAVQGFQDPDWHSDNPYRGTLIWQHPHFQDRFVSLWEEIAKRYFNETVIAGYNIMNEPVTGAPYGSYGFKFKPDWKTLNTLNKRTIKAIRKIDPEHIIMLEGDNFSMLFSGMDAPCAGNLVYSSHNYSRSGFATVQYPGDIGGEHWDRARQEKAFLEHEGTKYCRKHGVPLWVGEFGSLFNGEENDIPSRLRSDDDQISIFEQHGAHWTIWTYKDIGYMGAVALAPSSPYMRLMAPIFTAKDAVATDSWIGNIPPTEIKRKVSELTDAILEAIPHIDVEPMMTRKFMEQTVLAVYAGRLLQPAWAERFKGMSKVQIDRVMKSFALQNCQVNRGLVSIIRKHCQPK